MEESMMISSAEQVLAYQHLREAGELTTRIMIRPNIFQVEHVAALGFSRGFGLYGGSLIDADLQRVEAQGSSAGGTFHLGAHGPVKNSNLPHETTTKTNT